MTTAENRWRDLEGDVLRLAAEPAGPALLDELWVSAVAEVRTLHRDLALFEREPATFAPRIPTLCCLLRILRAQVRPGPELAIGGWRATAESGRDDLDRAVLELTLQRPVGASGVASALVLLVAGVPAADPRWPLPFEMLTLEDADRSGTSVIRSIERDEGDGAFVGLLTLRGGKPTGNPTDFGVRLGAQGHSEWIGGAVARPALEASARAEAAAASLAEEMHAAEAAAESARAARSTSSAPAPSRMAGRQRPRPGTLAERDAERSTTSQGSGPLPRRAGRGASPASSEPRGKAAPGRPAACARCGTALPAGAGFCSGCGASRSVAVTPLPRARPEAPAVRAEPRCGGCGEPLNPGARFCPKCGAAAAPARETPRADAPPRCARCGTLCQPGARFCRACGGPIGVAAVLIRCTRCGGELGGSARFCRGCGAPVGGGS